MLCNAYITLVVNIGWRESCRFSSSDETCDSKGFQLILLKSLLQYNLLKAVLIRKTLMFAMKIIRWIRFA